uniref:Receptor-type tyrosine-protein phosphatase eta n=1 Tax=Salvator merianae TaxID=96440 RepID=A0A8D0CED3_SALMN
VNKPRPVFDIHGESLSNTTVNLTWKTNYTSNHTVRNESSTNTSVNNHSPFSLFHTEPRPVFDIHGESLSNTTVNLTWKSNDEKNVTYRIVIEANYTSNHTVRNESSTNTSVVISGLEPGTLYTFKIYSRAADGETEGDPDMLPAYTSDPVSGIYVESVTNTTLNLKWTNSDQNAANYTYRIQIETKHSTGNEYFNTTSAIISNLQPGTFYVVQIYSQVDDGKIESEPSGTTAYTKPNPVSNFTVVKISTTTVTLSWEDNDVASEGYTYIVLYQQGNDQMNATSKLKNITIDGLNPGTSYNFSVFAQAEDNQTRGDPQSIDTYTVPSSVSDINITSISTTVISLSWKNFDAASHEYSYRIHIVDEAGKNRNELFRTTRAEISELEPGSNYTFSIYSVAGNNVTEGSPESINLCTNPARVERLDCEQVPKQPELILSWTYPDGRFHGFIVKVVNNDGSVRLDRTNKTTLKNLTYFTNYTVKITTLSYRKESLPLEITCCTSITDPPPPSNPPTITATSHNSLKVQFDNFNSSHGPLTAYAVIITTSKDYNTSLNYTYDDFINKKTNTYVAFVEDVQGHSSSPANNQGYSIEVGDGSETHGYYNGKLDPLGSYRAYVAGFTRIDYLDKSAKFINVERSYVSYSPCSNPVTLPQNPDVITGAVVGCILAAAVIATVGAFIFWKKRRNDGKNSEVPFSAIESKLLKVENFESYFKKQKADSNCGFAEEYEELRMVGINQPRFAAELPDNKGKNRYNNVLPYDISRVKLSVQNLPSSDYINANYMPGYNSKKEFIAAQGPLPNTVQDFWRMIWEKNIYTIVMLTKCVEQGRTKCEEYWPNKQSKNYGDVTVSMTSEIPLPEWTIRDFSMEKSDSSESHPVRQFHFTAWPDHGVPETTDLLISFRHLVKEYMKQNPPTSPALVHCSAGVGRTGTFIAIDRLIQQIEMENTVDVYGVVYDLRMHRSLMVQTEDQYVFLNQCVLDIIKSQKEKKLDLIYQNTNAMAIYENFTPSPHPGKANGYHV